MLIAKDSVVQIKALLWRDFRVRVRQPWMTALQFVWPSMIFMALLILRHKFEPYEIGPCQYHTRQLPSKGETLSFFQSYICTIENRCLPPEPYTEISGFEEAPITPVLNIVKIFLNDNDLFESVIELPETMDFIGAIVTMATNPDFSTVTDNIKIIINKIPVIREIVGQAFDVNKLFSSDDVFERFGKILCDYPFPRMHHIKLIDNVLYTKDYNGGNPDELNAMPTPYCKQLYLDVTSSNPGKITWRSINPIVHGKIVYGPNTERNRELIRYANQTLDELARLKTFTRSLDTSLNMLKNNKEFRDKFRQLIDLAKSPIVQAVISGFSIDVGDLESVLIGFMDDKTVSDVVNVVANILDCYTLDRFVPVDSEEELEAKALELKKKELFYAAIYFNESSDPNVFDYKIRVDIDNTPITLESRQKFWFPGPESSFELEMRYHRGFIQIQENIDLAIVRMMQKNRPKSGGHQQKQTSTANNDDDDDDDAMEFDDEFGDRLPEIDKNNKTPLTGDGGGGGGGGLLNLLGSFHPNITVAGLGAYDTEQQLADFLDFKDEEPATVVAEPDATTILPEVVREKRSPQLNKLFGLLLGGESTSDENGKNASVPPMRADDMKFYTKQFPYPKFVRDDFRKGLYVSQSVQLSFFLALIIQVACSVRHKIWMKESGNTMLMRSMGLTHFADTFAWFAVSLTELAIIFALIVCILYAGGVLLTTTTLFLYVFLMLFGCCVLAFGYMMSTFFSSASIGSISTVIFFLITFLPYIVIVSLGALLSTSAKMLASLSFSTAFCYAWHQIMRLELQGKELDFAEAFSGTAKTNDIKFGMIMLVVDLFIYSFIGWVCEHFLHDENKFHSVSIRDFDGHTGAVMKGVSKVYDTGKLAVDTISIVFRKDQITCLLGRNGAGKSTIIKMLTGQTLASAGEVHLARSASAHTKIDRIGLCQQNNVLIPNLTAREHLEMYMAIKMCGSYPSEVSRILTNLCLGKYENYRSCELSGGFKRRLCIANAFIGSPHLVILDEPCSGVDTKARKGIWDLIEVLRKDRAVILATHFLDEAENLGDHIVILNGGRIAAESSLEQLRAKFTQSFTLKSRLTQMPHAERVTLIDNLRTVCQQLSASSTIDLHGDTLAIQMLYKNDKNEHRNFGPLFVALNALEAKRKLVDTRVEGKNLQEVFNSLHNPVENGGHDKNGDNGVATKLTPATPTQLPPQPHLGANVTECDIIRTLFQKRLLHFKRSVRLLVCILLLPVVFEMIAMAFLTLRPPGEHDTVLNLDRDIYAGAKEFYSLENGGNESLQERLYDETIEHCGGDSDGGDGGLCKLFNTSHEANRWVLDTTDNYVRHRYGGISVNGTRTAVWFNNKGFHAMPIYLNVLNNALLKAETNNSNLHIRTVNHPLKMGTKELSLSSILQSIADSGISLIILLAFSLVISSSAVYIVGERSRGEKLQQTLCGVKLTTYWGVTFAWDFLLYFIALVLAMVVFKWFAIPAYVARNNLGGIFVLLLLYGFATIPMVHVCEKVFSDASFATMAIFCMNIVIGLCTLTAILMFDVLGESDTSVAIRNFLNRFFLVMPQHALADGLIEICKNYAVSEIFARFYINSYKEPLNSELLVPHFTALIVLGCVFIALNYAIESGLMRRLVTIVTRRQYGNHELQIISIQNSLAKVEKMNETEQSYVVRLENVSKEYNRVRPALSQVSLQVCRGECFGLLGANGAGKSTIFGILSGEIQATSGQVHLNRAQGLSYCPQNNALDGLLTVKEVIHFYAQLRGIYDLNEVTARTVEAFHLEPYEHVLVKNLSGGNRRKLSVAVTSFGDTQLVLMDEPTSDMDPVTRALVYKTIRNLNKQNRSVVLTSHSISEIENVCHRIAILKDGKLLQISTPDQLKKSFGNSYLIRIFYDKVEALTIERDIRNAFPNVADSLSIHANTLQFIVKVANGDNEAKRDDINEPTSKRMPLSELFDRLNGFTVGRLISFTIAECHLDKAFENVLESDTQAYTNQAFQQIETAT